MWQTYVGAHGTDQSVEQYLNAIKALAGVGPVVPAEKPAIETAVAGLLKNRFKNHSEDESLVRIIVAYRLATRFRWKAVKEELEVELPENGTVPAWRAHTLTPTPAAPINVMLAAISALNNDPAATHSVPLKTKVNAGLWLRQSTTHPGHTWDESWARILLAHYAAKSDHWNLADDELNHLEPSDPPAPKDTGARVKPPGDGG